MISGVKWSPQWRTPRKSTIFRNLQKIGKDTYRVVFKARDNITDQFVALKKNSETRNHDLLCEIRTY